MRSGYAGTRRSRAGESERRVSADTAFDAYNDVGLCSVIGASLLVADCSSYSRSTFGRYLRTPGRSLNRCLAAAARAQGSLLSAMSWQ